MPKHQLLLYVIIPFILTALLGCNTSVKKVTYLPTRHIDTSIYRQLNSRFNVSTYKATDYLGSLTPQYPIVFAYQMLFDPKGKTTSKDTDWVAGGFFPSARKIIVKTDSAYILINNRTELKKFYAPISSAEEALAYATLYNKSFAAFDDFFGEKKYTYEGKKPAPSYSIQKGDVYEVHLFSYKAFGCDHPYFSEVYKVARDGSVQLISKVRSFKNPADDGMCVD